jgi:hypothetical protein
VLAAWIEGVAAWFSPVGAWIASVTQWFAPVGAWFAPVATWFEGIGAWFAPYAETLRAATTDVPWWTVALVAVLVLRALVILGRGETGAAWRTLLALGAGGVVVAQLAVVGPDLKLLPLHVVAAGVVVLVPWERPHPEPVQLKMGRHRRRRRPPWPRTVLLLTLTALAATAFVLL